MTFRDRIVSLRPVRWWAEFREFRLFVGGLPALIAGLAAPIVTGQVDGGWSVASAYEAEAHRRLRAGQFEAANLCFGRLAADDPQEPRYRMGMALALLGQGDQAGADALIDELAPDGRAGYAPAHLWKARRRLMVSRPSPADERAAESHLRRVLETDPQSVEAHDLLGQLLVKTGRLVQAEPHLQRAGDRPEVSLQLARLEYSRGETREARRRAESARSSLRRRVEAHSDDHASRLNLAEASALLGEFGEAVEVLREGLTASGDPRYRPALAGVFVAWSEALAKESEGTVAERLSLLERGLSFDPSNPVLLDRLLAAMRIGGPAAESTLASMRSQLAAGKGTASLRYALGVNAWERGRPEQARLYWEEALRSDPGMAVIANNLAWALAVDPHPDLPRALRLIDPVVARWPNEPRFRGTRGQVLARLGRWKDALPDLEAALRVGSRSAGLHRTLAEAYEHLGDPEMAAEHRRLAGSEADAPAPPS